MSCVAHMKTSPNHHQVNPQTPEPPSLPAESIILSTLAASQSIPIPLSVCMGRIQLFLLPIFRFHTASTIGLHSSFKLYGYIASEKTPICP